MELRGGREMSSQKGILEMLMAFEHGFFFLTKHEKQEEYHVSYFQVCLCVDGSLGSYS